MSFNISDKLKLIRKKLGFTQQEMADKLEMKQSQYSLIERGIADFQLYKIENIIKLGVSPVWFLSNKENIINNDKIAFDSNYSEYSSVNANCEDDSDEIKFYDPENAPTNKRLIPIYDDISTIGGKLEKGYSANMKSSYSAPTEWIEPGDWFKGVTAAIRHYEESMIEYPKGCVLALKEVQEWRLLIPGRIPQMYFCIFSRFDS